MTVPVAVRQPLVDLVHDLIAGDYERVEADGRGGGLTAEEIRAAIVEYGATLVDLPEAALDEARTYRTRPEDDTYAVDLPLWTAEEGRSDLTLSVEAKVRAGRGWVSIENIHVL